MGLAGARSARLKPLSFLVCCYRIHAVSYALPRASFRLGTDFWNPRSNGCQAALKLVWSRMMALGIMASRRASATRALRVAERAAMPNAQDFSFSGRMRDELLNETMFRDLPHARSSIRAWAADYNEERPHSALGHQTPKAFAEGMFTATDRRATPPESSAHLSVATHAPIGVSTQRAPVPAG